MKRHIWFWPLYRWTVTIYLNHHAVGNIHNLTRLQSIRLVKQLNGAEQWQDQPIAGRRVRTQ